MKYRPVITSSFARLLYAVVAGLFWYGVAKEYQWTDGAFTATFLLSIVIISSVSLDPDKERKPALKAYQSDWTLIVPGTSVLMDLTGIPESHRDMLQINLAEDGVAVQITVSGPHSDESILRVDGGWGTHWAMTQVRRYARPTVAGGNNAEEPPST